MPKQNGLVYASCGVLYVGSLLQWRQNKRQNKKAVSHPLRNTKHPVAGLESSLAAQWIAISALAIVLSFTVEQAPEFGGPLALLILVVGLIRYAGVIGVTFNETQGSTK